MLERGPPLDDQWHSIAGLSSKSLSRCNMDCRSRWRGLSKLQSPFSTSCLILPPSPAVLVLPQHCRDLLDVKMWDLAVWSAISSEESTIKLASASRRCACATLRSNDAWQCSTANRCLSQCATGEKRLFRASVASIGAERTYLKLPPGINIAGNGITSLDCRTWGTDRRLPLCKSREHYVAINDRADLEGRPAESPSAQPTTSRPL